MAKVTLTIKRPNGEIEVVDATDRIDFSKISEKTFSENIFPAYQKATSEAGRGEILSYTWDDVILTDDKKIEALYPMWAAYKKEHEKNYNANEKFEQNMQNEMRSSFARPADYRREEELLQDEHVRMLAEIYQKSHAHNDEHWAAGGKAIASIVSGVSVKDAYDAMKKKLDEIIAAHIWD